MSKLMSPQKRFGLSILRKVDHGEQCPPTMKNAPFQTGEKQSMLMRELTSKAKAWLCLIWRK
jgi:hypothetical protein